MDVTVYNKRCERSGEVLDKFERTWQFAPGQLFILVSSDDLDPVRLIRATTNVILEPVT